MTLLPANQQDGILSKGPAVRGFTVHQPLLLYNLNMAEGNVNRLASRQGTSGWRRR